MREITAAELRQALGRLARQLEQDDEPILLKLGRRPVGVIVSLRDFRERFALLDAARERRRIIDEIEADGIEAPASVEDALDELRGR